MDKSVGAVVYRTFNSQIEYLLVKSSREENFWGIPKGHPENSESETETARREVYEETGCTVKIIPEFRKTIDYILPSGEAKQVVFFLAEPIAEPNITIINPAEIAESGWYDYLTAEELLTYENSKQILQQANEFILEHQT